jgi:ADP-heptose:LPS heptosyltransferase
VLDAHPTIKIYKEHLRSFADTAALVMEMDLVISVDTSVAHLAGALAKKLWILLPYAPDFRWLIDRQDTPWYPTARLFRQSQIGDWKTVIDAIVTELNQVSA